MSVDKKADVVRYIKMMSSIPEDFIDDFFSFYNEDTLQTDFAINLDNVAKWFGSEKSKLMETLRNSPYYKEGIDYKVSKAINPNRKDPRGNNYKQVLLTPDCFKHLSMMTRSKKGFTVRTYFIEIENLFIKYRRETLDGIEKEVQTLERNMKPKKDLPKGGVVYVVRASETKDSVYKIGKSIGLQQRLRSHQSALADDLEILYIYKTDNIDSVEKCAHALLHQYKYRKYKEVYQTDLNMIKQVIQGCAKISNTVMKLEKRLASKSKNSGGLYMVTSRDQD